MRLSFPIQLNATGSQGLSGKDRIARVCVHW